MFSADSAEEAIKFQIFVQSPLEEVGFSLKNTKVTHPSFFRSSIITNRY